MHGVHVYMVCRRHPVDAIVKVMHGLRLPPTEMYQLQNTPGAPLHMHLLNHLRQGRCLAPFAHIIYIYIYIHRQCTVDVCGELHGTQRHQIQTHACPAAYMWLMWQPSPWALAALPCGDGGNDVKLPHSHCCQGIWECQGWAVCSLSVICLPSCCVPVAAWVCHDVPSVSFSFLSSLCQCQGQGHIYRCGMDSICGTVT